ncbi:hypothetical protein T439DRAFT_347850 [Meredithblackwellia eburnea MCA 4105]
MPALINSFAQVGEQVPIPPTKFADLLNKGPFKDDLRRDLSTHGFHVVRQAIPVDRALAYRDRAFDWLERFNLGFDRNNEDTWTNQHLPPHIKGGMFTDEAKVYHERWVWDVRTEPGVIGAFAQLWGTDKLTTSFDGASVMLPRRKDLPPPSSADKWEHMDQSPNRTGFFVAQGLVNLNYNGPQDGGLMVLKGSSKLVEEYFATFPEEKANGNSWGPADWYGFTEKQQQWFFDRGCEWIKVCAEPGDLILWDSRCMHFNRRPTGDVDRVCTYVCMAPDELLSDADRATKRQLFETTGATTHNPFENIFIRPGTLSGKMQDRIMDPSDTILKLSAMKAY